MNSADWRNLNNDELLVELGNRGEELFNLRFQHATGELENTARLGAIRRDIARGRTVATERSLDVSNVH